jgi:hypothetical protein
MRKIDCLPAMGMEMPALAICAFSGNIFIYSHLLLLGYAPANNL